MADFPATLPENGEGDGETMRRFAELIHSRSARLGDPAALAHMDPPVPEIAAHLVGLNARYNQNLLHPSLSPFASEVERTVVDWLSPWFGMRAGHLCAGSTIANLSALWCAREHGMRRVAGSSEAHVSVRKAAHILGMPWTGLPVDDAGRVRIDDNASFADTALVLTAGTTGRGAIDPIRRRGAGWLHVDAAWAGPLRLTRHRALLDGIDRADSVAISAHKWFYQPKDCALVLFREPDMQLKIAFEGAYLAVPNVGVQGSRGAAAVPLLATLVAWGRRGLAERIEKNMHDATALAQWLSEDRRVHVHRMPETGVFLWRPLNGRTRSTLEALEATSSSTVVDGELWIRQVAANPQADIALIRTRIGEALASA